MKHILLKLRELNSKSDKVLFLKQLRNNSNWIDFIRCVYVYKINPANNIFELKFPFQTIIELIKSGHPFKNNVHDDDFELLQCVFKRRLNIGIGTTTILKIYNIEKNTITINMDLNGFHDICSNSSIELIDELYDMVMFFGHSLHISGRHVDGKFKVECINVSEQLMKYAIEKLLLTKIIL